MLIAISLPWGSLAASLWVHCCCLGGHWRVDSCSLFIPFPGGLLILFTGELLAPSMIVMGWSIRLGLLGYAAQSFSAAYLRVLVLYYQQVSSSGMVVVYLASSSGNSLGGDLCLYLSTIYVLSNYRPCPTNLPLLLLLLRIVFGGRKEWTIVNIIDNKLWYSMYPFQIFSCSGFVLKNIVHHSTPFLIFLENRKSYSN